MDFRVILVTFWGKISKDKFSGILVKIHSFLVLWTRNEDWRIMVHGLGRKGKDLRILDFVAVQPVV